MEPTHNYRSAEAIRLAQQLILNNSFIFFVRQKFARHAKYWLHHLMWREQIFCPLGGSRNDLETQQCSRSHLKAGKRFSLRSQTASLPVHGTELDFRLKSVCDL